jgi:hypothetical protein
MVTRAGTAAIVVRSGGENVQLYNNSIYGATPYSDPLLHLPNDGIRVEGTVTGLDVRNNLIKDVTGDSIEVASGTTTSAPTFDYDLLHDKGSRQCAVRWGGTCYATLAAFRTATGREQRGLEADPLFVDAGTRNLHLLSGSPAIDAGADLTAQVTLDVDNDSRPQPAGGRFDIGADELAGATARVPAAPTLLDVVPAQ